MGTTPLCSEHGAGCLRIFCEIKLSLQSRASFSDLIFQKCSESETINFFSIFKCKPSSRCSPVRFLSTTFPDRGGKPQKQRPYTSVSLGATLPEKTQGFAPESVFTREFTCFRAVTLLCCSRALTALANFAVDMAICFRWTWLCGGQDDVVDVMVWMLTMTIVRSSEVF